MSDGEENSAAEEDPFEQLESDVADREGDPFENLPDGATAEETVPSDNRSKTPDESDEETGEADEHPVDSVGWVGELGLDDTAATHSASTEGDATDSEPADNTAVVENTGETASSEMNLDVGRGTDELSDPLGDVGKREGDPFEETGSLFEKRDTESIDPDAVWQELASADFGGSAGEPYERTFADVSKHSYCGQCEHFSPPPDITCTHEGADIVEFLDMETVRVVDCPIVTERRELEREG